MEEILKTILKEQPELISDVVCKALARYSNIVDTPDEDIDYDNTSHYEGVLVNTTVWDMLYEKDNEISVLKNDIKKTRDLEVKVKMLEEKLNKKDKAFKRLKDQYQEIINEAE